MKGGAVTTLLNLLEAAIDRFFDDGWITIHPLD